jgi:hypothetical protein
MEENTGMVMGMRMGMGRNRELISMFMFQV